MSAVVRPAPRCQLVMIEWEDSAQPIPEWTHLASFEPPAIVRVFSVGWLIHDGSDVKALAPNIGNPGCANSAQISGVIRIPARCVVRVVELDEPELDGGENEPGGTRQGNPKQPAHLRHGAGNGLSTGAAADGDQTDTETARPASSPTQKRGSQRSRRRVR